MPAARLLSLPDELVVMIASFCCVKDVIHFASVSFIPVPGIPLTYPLHQTCRFLVRLNQNRALWIHFLSALDVQQAPNISPTHSLSGLTTLSIREIVIDALKKDHEWHTREHAKILHSQELRIPAPGGAEPRTCISARILPGGKEVVVLNCGRIEIWSLEEGQCIWACPDYEGGQFCLTYDFELADDKKSLNIACVFDSMIQVYP